MRLALLLLLGLVAYPAWAQVPGTERADGTATVQPSAQPILLPRLSGPITLDGRPDEPAWDAVPMLGLTVFQPVYGATPTEPTEIRVAYDDQYLYVSGRLYDSRPENIRVNSLYRDQYSGDDGMAIVIDSFNDHENALWFICTAGGVRLDWAVSNDGVSPPGVSRGAINTSWNTFWDAETYVGDDGWYAEVRIPFSSLGFQDDNGRVEMGLIAYRFLVQHSERHIFPNIAPGHPMAFAKPSLAQPVVLEGVYGQRPIYVTPYVAGGLSQTPLANDEGTYTRPNDLTRNVGLDLKANLTSNLTLDLTVNTDFAQVEADEAQVNLTRFSLFLPEKRQFFQERAGIFSFPTGRRDRLFYSRRIGLFDGQTVPILGGARLIGRIGAWDVGMINMQTARATLRDGDGDALGRPTENFGVLRLRRQMFNAYSYLGALVTNRLDADGGYNTAYGLDGSFRPYGDDYLSVRWAQTFDSDLQETQPDYDAWQAATLRINWERRRSTGFYYMATYKWYGRDYLPGMGFVTRSNIKAYAVNLSYGWLGDAAARFRTAQTTLATVLTVRNEDNSIETGRLSWSWDAENKTNHRFSLSPAYQFEDLNTALAFPADTDIPAGRYHFAKLDGRYTASRVNKVRANANGSVGTFYDGWRVDVGAGPTWNASRHLVLSGEYALNSVRFPDRDQGFDAHIVRLRIQGALNRQLSASAFLQFSSIAELASSNVRLRYNLREGNDLWLVWNEGRFTEDDPLDPRRPTLLARTVQFKYTYTFVR